MNLLKKPSPSDRPASAAPLLAARTSLASKLGVPLFLLGCIVAGAAVGLMFRHHRAASSASAPDEPPTTEFTTSTTAKPLEFRGVAIADPDLPTSTTADTAWIARLDALPATGANWILLTPDWSNDSPAANQLQNLKNLIAHAHTVSLKVALVPRLAAPKPPADGILARQVAPALQKTYAEAVRRAAVLAVSLDADMFGVGYDALAGRLNESFWTPTLKEVRQTFHGSLMFVSTLIEYPTVTWCAAFDYLGVAGPFPISWQPEPTPHQLQMGWNVYLTEMQTYSQREARPMILLNVGFPPYADAARNPDGPGPPSPNTPPQFDLQHLCYEATLIAAQDTPWLSGLFLNRYNLSDSLVPACPLNSPALLQILNTHWHPAPVPTPATVPATATAP